jgi:hypothetical protein
MERPKTIMHITTKVAAVFNFPMGKNVMKGLVNGDELILRREPTNPHDPNAIMVFAASGEEGNFVQIGYVPKQFAAKLKNSHLIKAIKDPMAWDAMAIEYVD